MLTPAMGCRQSLPKNTPSAAIGPGGTSPISRRDLKRPRRVRALLKPGPNAARGSPMWGATHAAVPRKRRWAAQDAETHASARRRAGGPVAAPDGDSGDARRTMHD